ncbi:MAG: phosphoenolpyruvate carboxylase [Planctomycetota bacterium]
MFEESDHALESLRVLMTAFDRVLESVGAQPVAEHLPWQPLWRGTEGGAASAVDPYFPAEKIEDCLQASAIAFRLLSHAEENAVAQERRHAEVTGAKSTESGSWEQAFVKGKNHGVAPKEMAEWLSQIEVEPVLTAHPTESKRQTVLEQHRQLYRHIVELENSMWTPAERADFEASIESCLERLWRTGEIYLEKPRLADERSLVLYFLHEVFPAVLPWASRRVRDAWRSCGLPPEMLEGSAALPKVRFGTWVGGDRDGHPGVTAEVTEETLALLRDTAVDLFDGELAGLASSLSLAVGRQPVPSSLPAAIEERVEQLGKAGQKARGRNSEEPWRQWINLMRVRLKRAPEVGGYAGASDLIEDLHRLRSSLVEVGATRLAEREVDPVLVSVNCFGLHMAVLDVRQNSAFHDRALAALLQRAGVPDAETYPDWSRDRRRPMLEQELETVRPFTGERDVPDGEAQAVLQAYRALSSHAERFGTEGLGALIVSMTRNAEDLLAVYLLARDAGLLRDEAGEHWCPLEIVPLFETIDDLEAAPAILDDYLTHPLVQASLDRQRIERGGERPVQQVMVGYSDSSKDGGIVASFWGLHRSQQAIVDVASKHGVDIRFFHGRGGSIGRGSGPTHRFVRALPRRSASGRLRVTEQGETISQKYANRVTAAHHLEFLGAGALAARIRDHHPNSVGDGLSEVMDRLSESSRKAYRGLLESPGFIHFFGAATPIDVIEASRIGSRPPRRSGRRTLGDLRAIPWVFAWNQSRFMLPGWFGFGSAMHGLATNDPDAMERLVRAKSETDDRWPPFHYLVSNVATAWMMASPDRMRDYAALVEDPATRDPLLECIEQEYALTGELLQHLYGAALEVARPRIHAVLSMRDEALVPVHQSQIEMLKHWRSLVADKKDEQAKAKLPSLLLSVNTIAAGLGVTG